MTKYTVEKYGNRIRLSGKPTDDREFTDYLTKCRSVVGNSFSQRMKWWTYPLNIEICRDLRTAFGEELFIGPELDAWAREEVARAAASRPMLSATTAELENLPTRAPAMHSAMLNRPYQLPAVAVMAARGTWLEGDQPGLGKTIITLGAIVERNARGQYLIVAPKTSVTTVWLPEIQRWMAGVAGGFSVTVGTADGRQRRESIIAGFERQAMNLDRPAYMFLIVNPEMVRTKKISLGCSCDDETCPRFDFKVYGNQPGHSESFALEHNFSQLHDRVWTGIVGDEIHKMLIRKDGKGTQTRNGMCALRVRPDEEGGCKYALSGTPYKGKTKNLWGTLNWLRPLAYTSFWNWANKFLDVSNDGYGMVVGELDSSKKEAFYRDLDNVMIRRTKKELRALNPAWAPPEKMYELVECTMGPKQQKLYKAMEENAAVSLESGRLLATGVLAEMTRMRQFAHACGDLVPVMRKNPETGLKQEYMEFRPSLPSAKFDQILQRLEERGISGDQDEQGEGVKIVIASQFTAMINLYVAELTRLGIPTLVLTGETSDKARTAAVQQFQAPGGPRVFFLNTSAGGVSITLDAADEAWILDETWVPDDQEQVEDRIHRTSNVNHSVTISYFATQETIEQEIAQVTASRDATQKMHLDGRRGIDFAKSWLDSRK